MIRSVRSLFAICTFVVIAALAGAPEARADANAENIAAYQRAQIQWGATALTLNAQLEYRDGRDAFKRGDRDAAIEHFTNAIALDPLYADPHFTLSWVNFSAFKPDALFYLVGGFKAIWLSFRAQSLLAINLLVTLLLVLSIVAAIVCVAFAIRYLPFVAYRLGEIVREHTGAAFPRATATLLVLVPFVLLPGFITGFCFTLLMTWHFMQKRERFVMLSLMVPFITLGILAPRVEQFTRVADPSSFVSLSAQAMRSSGDTALIGQIEQFDIPALEVEKQNVLGLLRTRQENYDAATQHYLRAISLRPDNAVAYINLGNVYYVQGLYTRALEGYRKAERLAPNDPIGQYNLAQAYIKTTLYKESEKALNAASATGIESVRNTYADAVRPTLPVYPRTWTAVELWRIAGTEGATQPGGLIDSVAGPLLRFDMRVSAWILIAMFLVTLVISRSLKPRHLAFQCSNCGDLTSEASCSSERGTFICQSCAEVIKDVSSDKVIEALLRQRRQGVLVRRRRGIRMVTMWVPGVRDVFYGRIFRGVFLSGLFALSLILLWSRGFVIKDWYYLDSGIPMWKWIIPAVGIFVAYAMSLFSRQYFEVRNYRSPSLRSKSSHEDDSPNRATA